MASKRETERFERNWRREGLERYSTEDLQRVLEGHPTSDGRHLVVNGGGKTLIREILRARGIADQPVTAGTLVAGQLANLYG